MSDIARSDTTLRIYGSELNLQKLTQLLRCQPTQAAATGEQLTLHNGKTRIVKEGFWRLDYSDEPCSVIVEEQLETLLGKLTDDLAIWQQITNMFDVDIFCGLFLDGWNEGFSLSQPMIKKLSDRNLTIGFDIYSPTDTWYKDDETKNK